MPCKEYVTILKSNPFRGITDLTSLFPMLYPFIDSYIAKFWLLSFAHLLHLSCYCLVPAISKALGMNDMTSACLKHDMFCMQSSSGAFPLKFHQCFSLIKSSLESCRSIALCYACLLRYVYVLTDNDRLARYHFTVDLFSQEYKHISKFCYINEIRPWNLLE